MISKCMSADIEWFMLQFSSLGINVFHICNKKDPYSYCFLCRNIPRNTDATVKQLHNIACMVVIYVYIQVLAPMWTDRCAHTSLLVGITVRTCEKRHL